MVQSRREPTISSSDFTAPLEEDVPQRVGGGQSPRRKSAPTPAPKKSGMGLAIFAFLVALCAVGAGGFAIWQNLELNQQLTDATARILELENRLTLSDDESSQSVTALQANLKQAVKNIGTNESEIRKLWDTRNVNRKAIAQNSSKSEGAVGELRKEIQGLDKSLAANKAEQSQLATQFDEMMASSESVERQIDKLRSQLAELETVSKKIAQVDQLNGRVRSNEEAIEAIDAYRLNINRQLVELQQKLTP